MNNFNKPSRRDLIEFNLVSRSVWDTHRFLAAWIRSNRVSENRVDVSAKEFSLVKELFKSLF